MAGQVTGAGGVYLTDDMIINEAMFQYKNNLVACRNVYRDLEKRVVNGVGDQISVKKPFRSKSVEGRTLGKSALVDNSVTLTISRQRNVGLEFTLQDRTLSIQTFSERYIMPAIGEIATQVDKSIFDAANEATYFTTGTLGAALTHTSVMFTKADLNNVGIPDDGNRKAMLNEMDAANISSAVSALFNPTLVSDSVKKGYVGPLSGFETFSSQLVPTHTVGAHGGTPLSSGGVDQTGASILTDGWTVSITGLLKKGDTLTFAGVFEINPITYESTGRLQSFVVTADVNSSAGGLATIPISPSINDGTLTTTDTEGNSVSLAAYQNVSAPIADGAAIVVNGIASGIYRQNFYWHKNAIGFAMVDLYLPESAASASRVRDADTGLSLSLTKDYDITNHKEVTRLDALWGVSVMNPELIFRNLAQKIN
jgi:hypothetical protein